MPRWDEYTSGMLGWHITVFRQAAGGDSPASFEAATGATLAVWQTGVGGLNWLDGLVEKGLAISLGGNGYPTEYTARLEHIKATILNGPPLARETWVFQVGDILTDKWLGKATVDHKALCQCTAEEWVLIQAWDES
jgi:hypothetical protein